jgi:hypothetical protein
VEQSSLRRFSCGGLTCRFRAEQLAYACPTPVEDPCAELLIVVQSFVEVAVCFLVIEDLCLELLLELQPKAATGAEAAMRQRIRPELKTGCERARSSMDSGTCDLPQTLIGCNLWVGAPTEPGFPERFDASVSQSVIVAAGRLEAARPTAPHPRRGLQARSTSPDRARAPHRNRGLLR